MPKFVNLVGRSFGRLEVLEHIGRTKSLKQLWKCRCICGRECQVDGGSLVSGNTSSCGCFLKETITKHGGWKKSSYNTWRAMMRRCYVEKDKDFANWGAKGVAVYPAWHEYNNFERDMGEPVGNQTLDRIDPYGDYEPTNCRWASTTAQARNIRGRNNTSGVMGVYKLESGGYLAKITVKKKSYYGKVRKTLAEAIEDRKQLIKLHWKDTHGTSSV